VSRVAFVDAHSALVTYRAYYMGVPSSVVRTPLTGVVEQIDGQWRLSAAGLCELSQAANIQCAGAGGPTAAELTAPPNGWNPPDSVPGAVQAFRVLADPTTSVEQRLALVDRGDQLVLRTGATNGGRMTQVLPSGEVQAQSVPTGSTMRVAGVFTPAGGDVADINLVVMRAEDLGAATNRQTFDRIDVVAAKDVPAEDLLDRVAAALPPDTMVVPPSVVGFDEQLRAELEIQRAYHWLLSPDRSKSRDTSFGGPDDP